MRGHRRQQGLKKATRVLRVRRESARPRYKAYWAASGRAAHLMLHTRAVHPRHPRYWRGPNRQERRSQEAADATTDAIIDDILEERAPAWEALAKS